jgi:hypothetical protein
MAHEELSVDGLQYIHEACLVGTIWRNNDLTGVRRLLQGGGRSSARETIGRVAAGAVAKKLLQLQSGTEVGECQQFCGHLLQLCTKVLTC